MTNRMEGKRERNRSQVVSYLPRLLLLPTGRVTISISLKIRRRTQPKEEEIPSWSWIHSINNFLEVASTRESINSSTGWLILEKLKIAQSRVVAWGQGGYLLLAKYAFILACSCQSSSISEIQSQNSTWMFGIGERVWEVRGVGVKLS